jgi:hypothetical protein
VSSRTLRLAFPLLLIGLLLPATADAAEIVKDGGFESSENPDWEQGGIVFLPICDSTCTEDGTGGGTVAPRTGSKWVWFGGNVAAEEQFVSQAVTIPPGPATLTFYLWLGAQSGNGLDVFRAFIDDTELFEVLESSTEYGSYTLVTIDVSAHAGSQHELRFEYAGFGPGATNFSLDDISLQAGGAGGGSVTLKGPKKVTRGKKAQLTASVQPCAGDAGETIDLFRGKKKVRTAVTDVACTAKFKVKIKRTSTFRAVSPAGTSNSLKVRVRR